jgi:hypothetical protein
MSAKRGIWGKAESWGGIYQTACLLFPFEVVHALIAKSVREHRTALSVLREYTDHLVPVWTRARAEAAHRSRCKRTLVRAGLLATRRDVTAFMKAMNEHNDNTYAAAMALGYGRRRAERIESAYLDVTADDLVGNT